MEKSKMEEEGSMELNIIGFGCLQSSEVNIVPNEIRRRLNTRLYWADGSAAQPQRKSHDRRVIVIVFRGRC